MEFFVGVFNFQMLPNRLGCVDHFRKLACRNLVIRLSTLIIQLESFPIITDLIKGVSEYRFSVHGNAFTYFTVSILLLWLSFSSLTSSNQFGTKKKKMIYIYCSAVVWLLHLSPPTSSSRPLSCSRSSPSTSSSCGSASPFGEERRLLNEVSPSRGPYPFPLCSLSLGDGLECADEVMRSSGAPVWVSERTRHQRG